MDSSRSRRACLVRRWKAFVAGWLWAACILGGELAWAQQAPQQVLNPFTIKARPAAMRPLPGADSATPARAKTGGLRPASIRPAEAREVENPHISPPAGRKSAAKPVAGLRSGAAEKAVAPIKPHTLPAVTEEEHLAPIIPASQMKRRPGKKPVPPKENSQPVAPAVEPLPDRPLSPWMKDIRQAEKAAAIEEVAEDAEAASEPAAAEPPAADIAPDLTPLLESPQRAASLPEAPLPDSSASTSALPELVTPEALAGGAAMPRVLMPGNRSAEDSPPPAVAAEEPAELDSQQPAPIVVAPREEQQSQDEPEEIPEKRRARVSQFEKRREPRALLVHNHTQADQAEQPPPAPLPAEPPPAAGPVLPEGSPFEAIAESGTLTVQVRRSLLLRTQKDVFRTAVVDDAICEIVQFTPRELSIIGRAQGSTHVTFWFDDPNMLPVTYEVEVVPDAKQVKIDEGQYQLLEDVLNEMFPDSKIHLTLAANKLIVRGQAKDSEEAFQIMTIIRGQAQGRGGLGYQSNAGINEGQAAQPLADTAVGAARRANYQIVNMLRVPGVQQVALRVKIAELNRTAARNFGIDIKGTIDIGDSSKILLNSLSSVATGETPPILFNVDGDDISIGLNALQQQGVVKLLSEPTLVTMSGRPATFLAGGEFAVPTVVGSAGLNAVTTDFRAFGAIISFLPTVVDKDRIRLEVAPEFSEINSKLSTGGASTGSIPSLNVRAATTTVEMREGQTLAIAGLLQDSMTANNAGDLPFLQRIIGRRGVTRNENELIILVTPELVHPMEPEEVPPLPGFDVTEPTNTQFYLHGDIEGNPTMDYRSTVWPRLKKRYKAGGPAMTSGPFGHGK